MVEQARGALLSLAGRTKRSVSTFFQSEADFRFLVADTERQTLNQRIGFDKKNGGLML